MQEEKIEEMRDTLIAISVKMDYIVEMVKKVERHETFINNLKGGLIVITSGGVITGTVIGIYNLFKIFA